MSSIEEKIINRLKAYSFPILLGVVIYFMKQINDKVDKIPSIESKVDVLMHINNLSYLRKDSVDTKGREGDKDIAFFHPEAILPNVIEISKNSRP
jgi:hypothetical protein